MTRFLPTLLLSLSVLSACDNTGPGDTSTTSSTSSTNTGDEDPDRALPAGETSTSGDTSCGGGLPCTFDPQGSHDCPTGQCVPHPASGLLFCVQPCTSSGCSAPALDCNGDEVAGECLPDADGVPSCFPA